MATTSRLDGGSAAGSASGTSEGVDRVNDGVSFTAGGLDVEDGIIRSPFAGRRREDRIVGASDATRRLIAQATVAARSELPVWLSGPAGSDKELLARAIHAWSGRAARPLEVLSCGALPEPLQGRELFGCAEGVYPAVPGEHEGILDRAAGTSLLLDGVEDFQPTVAERLWRVLEVGVFRREGDGSERPLRARLILSTDEADPAPLGSQPHHAITIPPLAERSEDVLPLAAHFLRSFSEEAGLPVVGFSADARTCLASEEWPGDVRELRERVRQAVLLARDGTVTAEALMLAKDSEEIPSFKEAKRAFETRYVVGLLRRCSGNISRAARLAKKDRKDFYDVIRRTGIDPADFR
jgi:two-component system response regulator GlrR